jgi:hypothetical protein
MHKVVSLLESSTRQQHLAQPFFLYLALTLSKHVLKLWIYDLLALWCLNVFFNMYDPVHCEGTYQFIWYPFLSI